MTFTNAIRGLTVRPYSLRAVDQLPEALLELANSHLPEGQAIEGIFVVPPETHKRGFGWRLNPLQALIFTQQGVLHLAASSKKGRPGEAVWIQAGDVFMIKFSLILLYEKLEIFGAQNDQIIKIELEYHAVAHDLLTPPFTRPDEKDLAEKSGHPAAKAGRCHIFQICVHLLQFL
jgi:hypothetical protein